MSRKVHKSAAAIRDLEQQLIYLIERSVSVAERFLNSTEATFRRLLESPTLGSSVPFANPKLSGLRMWRVEGFERYLVFYRHVGDGIEIARVIHSARDWLTIFAAVAE